MVRLLKPVKTSIITKEGEAIVKIELDLNVNITTDGLQVTVKDTTTSGSSKVSLEEDDDINWAVPDFGGSEKIKFGKKVQE